MIFHLDDYERAEESVDPVVSQAVYELELRLEEMNKFNVRLKKDATGYGLAIIAMGVDPEIERLGIYIKDVIPEKAADRRFISMLNYLLYTGINKL